MNIRTPINGRGTDDLQREGDHAYARLLAAQARLWASYAVSLKTMPGGAVYRKALDAMAFSLKHHARGLAIPSKLSGTSHHQEVLQALHELKVPFGEMLFVEAVEGSVVVYYGDRKLGAVQDKHAWLLPLLPYGARVCFLRITGTDHPAKLLGCNVAFIGVVEAIGRRSTASGDGASTHAPISLQDVVLWRSADGSPMANVPHLIRHSIEGIAWGDCGGGAADLSRSILMRFTGPEAAERLYQRFKEEVVATVPEEGGVLSAGFIWGWLEEQR